MTKRIKETLFNSAQEIIDTLRIEEGFSLWEIYDFLRNGEELEMYGFYGKADYSMVDEARQIVTRKIGFREAVVDGKPACAWNDGTVEFWEY